MNTIMKALVVLTFCLIAADWREDFTKRVPIYLMDTAGLSNDERAEIIGYDHSENTP